MRNRNFLQWHIQNGGDVSKTDGNRHEEPKEPRKANPSLKQYNHKFINQINVVDAQIVANKKNN